MSANPGLSMSGNSDSELEALNDVDLAKEGVVYLLNNDWGKAQDLFSKYKDSSPLMCAGDSMVTFMQALMTFEDEQLQLAMRSLQETEQMCNTSESVFKSIKNKLRRKKGKVFELEDKLQRQIIVADCIMYQALLTFLNQDIPSYIKGGWLLRKAFKQYEKLKKEISKLSEQGSSTDSEREESSDPPRTWKRLLGAVSFGYGTFQLAISLVPPRILKLIELLGFEGDREKGLEALSCSSTSEDMKAPLASLALIWYHTVIRPFFALDGNVVNAGVPQAYQLISDCEKLYPSSSLFMFFKGRAQRLESKLDEALITYRAALELCHEQREVQLICYHEIGWLEMMLMNYDECSKCFLKLKEDSRWSKCYYAYLSALSLAALGHKGKAVDLLTQVPGLVRRRNNQIEAYVQRRASFVQSQGVTPAVATLLLLEVVYLWNALSQCPISTLPSMLEHCKNGNSPPVCHISSLLQGVIQEQLGDEAEALMCYRNAISQSAKVKGDDHIAAFAYYEIGLLQLGDAETFDEGRRTLLKARDDYNEYDFDNRLSVRINNALRRAKEDGTPL